MPTTDVPGGRSCHDARCRLRHVIDEGGASTVSSDSSFWRVECRRVLSCSTDRRESCLGGRGLILTEASRGSRGTVQQENCRGGRAGFLAHAINAQGRVKWPVFRCSIKQKRSVDNVHTFQLGLPRTTAGLARIPHVSEGSQCFQGSESRSSPTSGTAYPPRQRGFLL